MLSRLFQWGRWEILGRHVNLGALSRHKDDVVSGVNRLRQQLHDAVSSSNPVRSLKMAWGWRCLTSWEKTLKNTRAG